MLRKVFFSFCIGALILAPMMAQDFFVLKWEENYSTEKQKEIIQCMAVGDLDNDGNPEIVAGLIVRPQSGFQRYAVQILDHRGNKKQRWDSTFSINDICISDVDDDGVAEILVSTADLYVLSNKALNLNYPPFGTVVFSTVAVDLDSDGREEILVGTRDVTCMGDVLNWKVSIGSQVKKILISDLNWDSVPEIVVLTAQNVYVLGRNGEKLWISPGTQNLRDVAVEDIDGDSTKEILFSTDNNLILIWEARDDGMQGEISLAYRADFLTVEDLNKDGTLEIAVASSKLRLEILDLEGNSLWQHRFESVESQDVFSDMIAVDMNGDTWTDILLAHSVADMTGGLDSFLYLMENQLGVPLPPAGTDYFDKALELYQKGECRDAVPLFKQAQTAFLNEGNEEMANQCQAYIDQCEYVQALQTDADTTFSQAESLFQEGEYDSAEKLYKEAMDLFEELGDSEKVEKCLERIAEIDEMKVPETEKPEPQEEEGSRMLPIILSLVAVAGCGFLIVMKLHKRPALKAATERISEEKGKEIPEEKPEEIKKKERDLKAQFVFGEINRNEYKEKLRKLYEEES